MSSTAEKEKEHLPIIQSTKVHTLRPGLACWWLLRRLSQEGEAGSGGARQRREKPRRGCTESGDRGAQRRLGRSRDSLRNWDHASEPSRPSEGRLGVNSAARIGPLCNLRGGERPGRQAESGRGSWLAAVACRTLGRSCNPARRRVREYGVAPVPAWVPGSRKHFGRISWDRHPLGVWKREAAGGGRA